MTERRELVAEIIQECTPLFTALQGIVLDYAGCHECAVAVDRLKAIGSAHVKASSEWEYYVTLSFDIVGEEVLYDYVSETGTCELCEDSFEIESKCQLDQFAFAVAHRGDFSTLFTKGFAHGMTSLGEGHVTQDVKKWPDEDLACGYALRYELGYDVIKGDDE